MSRRISLKQALGLCISLQVAFITLITLLSVVNANSSRQVSRVAVAFAFNYKVDPQRKRIHAASLDYMKTWVSSLKRLQMHGIIMGDMFSAEKWKLGYQDQFLEFLDVNKTHSWIRDVSESRSINDMVYFLAWRWLKVNQVSLLRSRGF
jgi:hypothetical protein